MPFWFWGGYWAWPWGGLSWVMPVIGLIFMAVMIFACLRMLGGAGGFGCMGGHHGRGTDPNDDLRREIQGLREEVRRLRDRS